MKPSHLCRHDGCGARALWQAILVLRGSPIKGETTIRVCDGHLKAAEAMLLNDQNRDSLVSLLVNEGFADRFVARGMVKHNAAVAFERIPEPQEPSVIHLNTRRRAS
jgi:hypothetical protein